VIEDGEWEKISKLHQRKKHFANDARLGYGCLEYEREIRNLTQKRYTEAFPNASSVMAI